jgi:hypothetical protein
VAGNQHHKPKLKHKSLNFFSIFRYFLNAKLQKLRAKTHKKQPLTHKNPQSSQNDYFTNFKNEKTTKKSQFLSFENLKDF